MLYPEKVLKQYGLPRSGTNYVKFFIETNYYVKVFVNFNPSGIVCWKHGEYVPTNISCFATIKNPYSWIVSLYLFTNKNWKSWNRPPWSVEAVSLFELESFIKNKFVTCPHGAQVNDVTFLGEAKEYANPIDYWNAVVGNWLNAPKMTILKFEDLMDGFEFDLIKRYKKSIQQQVKMIVQPGFEDKATLSKKKFNSNYYKNKEFMTHHTEKTLQAMNDLLDFNLMNELKYAEVTKT